MRYERKIRYLDYYENGERVRGGGFLKLETADTLFRLELTVRGVRGMKEFSPDVILCGDDREETWGKIALEDGQGELRQECQADAGIGGTGIRCSELTGIRIPLGEGKEISCRWERTEVLDVSAGKESVRSEKRENADIPEKRGGHKRRGIKKAEEEVSKLKSEEGQSEDATMPAEAADRQPESAASQPREIRSQSEERTGSGFEESAGNRSREIRSGSEENTVSHSREIESRSEENTVSRFREIGSGFEESTGNRSREIRSQSEDAASRSREAVRQPEAVPLLEDKWLQLCAIYPHIKPFQDQREYLSIRPEDFVLLSADSYKAAGNSFMLHGYYNYRHLILTREERRGEILYYVGVPGNYYDREKQVAVMFGFESFECAQEPAQSSDFGYYMMRVQI